jgi:pimeloyl-ACP methyl ester carboxylesterase
VTGSFTEAYVEADGFRVRYLSAGSGPPLAHIHTAGGLKLSRGHELLAERFRVIAPEIPGFGEQANDRSETYLDLGLTLVQALHLIEVEHFNLWGSSFGGAVALWTAIAAPDATAALVLEAPGAILPEDGLPEVNTREELHQFLYAHPERHPLSPALDPTALERRRSLVERLQRMSRQTTEQRMAQLAVPTLAIFGALDRLIPAAIGRVYSAHLPRCECVTVDDAAHDIAADRPEEFARLVADFLDQHA